MKIKLKRKWKIQKLDDIEIYTLGYIHNIKILEDLIYKIKQILSPEKFLNLFNQIDGHFSLIVKSKKFNFIVVDKIRSYPLFFIKDDKEIIVSDSPDYLQTQDLTLNEDALIEFAMSGYTINNKTVFNEIKTLKAGQYLFINEDGFYEYFQYYKYFGEIEYKSYEKYIEELTEVTLNVFKKMIKSLNNKEVIIPLSAGNDSRLVASILKHLKYKNVKLFSYGTPGNFEAKIAQKIAEKLNYPWIFIPLTYKQEKNFYKSLDYIKYLDFSKTHISVPYVQGLSSVKYIKELNFIENDSIFINGNSGDFISGGHITQLYKTHKVYYTSKQRKENILNRLIDKHFSLWGYLKNRKNLEVIKQNLWEEIETDIGGLTDFDKDHLLYEYSELMNRQSKYVVWGQQVYDFYKYEWRLPLWDDEYLYFWQKVPLEYKFHQKLYIDMLKKNNWGDVWDNSIPVNKKTITPKWIIPIRFLCKIPFGLFGKKGKKWWHYFDNSVFNYWMIENLKLQAYPYFSLVKDFYKQPRGIDVCWLSENYLKGYLERNKANE